MKSNIKVTAILSITLLIIFGFSTLKTKKPTAEVNWIGIEQAQKLAKESPKKVFIDFTAKWCGWCKVMDKKTFSDPEVAAYMNEHYYTVKMDFDSPETFTYLGEAYTAKQLANKYGITGLPTMLLASADFQTVIQVVGFQKANPFLKKLKQFNE